MESNDELIYRKLAQLKRSLVIVTDPSEKFKLKEDIKDIEAMLSGSSALSVQNVVPVLEESLTTSGGNSAQRPTVPTSTKTKVPWWAISLGAAIVTILVSWWTIASLKIAVIIGLVTFVILLLRDPERIYLRLALLSMGLVVTLNVINFSGMMSGRVGENTFEVRLTEPSIFVSLFLIVFAGYMMYLHSKRE